MRIWEYENSTYVDVAQAGFSESHIPFEPPTESETCGLQSKSSLFFNVKVSRQVTVDIRGIKYNLLH